MLRPPTWWVGTVDLSEDQSTQLSSDVPQLYTNTNNSGFSHKPVNCCLLYIMGVRVPPTHPHAHRENILECKNYAV